jgi:hypothetical protein
VGGLEHPAIRRPLLSDGTPWPIVTHDQIASILARQGGAVPTMTVYVPLDGVGPMLVGKTSTVQFDIPKGYDEVTLKGTPQETYPGGFASVHAYDSIDEAMTLAGTNRFSEIYFNRSISMVSGQKIKGLIRPDVTGVARPQFSIPYLYRPYESFSKGQKQQQRQKQMPDDPGIARVYGRPPEKWKKP